MDDYLSVKTKNDTDTGIYFSLANFSTDIYMKPISKFCLTTFKSQTDQLTYFEILKIVVIDQCNAISCGIKEFFFPLQKEVNFYGGVHVFVADHMGAIQNLGRLSPMAQFPSRFFSDDIDFQISSIIHPTLRVWKDSIEHKEKMEEIFLKQKKYGQITKMKDMAQKYGMFSCATCF